MDGGGWGVAGAGGQVSDQQDWGIVMVEYVVHSGRGAGGTSRGSPGWVKWGSSAWRAGTACGRVAVSARRAGEASTRTALCPSVSFCCVSRDRASDVHRATTR